MTMRDDARLPPHSIEAEQSVLGAVLLDNSALDRINGSLTAADFYFDSHRVIYEYARNLHDDGKPVDVTTLQSSLEGADKLGYVGGLSYLGTLLTNVPTAANARHYADIVRHKAELRRVTAVALSIAEAASVPGADPASILGDAVGQFDALAADGAAGRYGFLDFERARLRDDMFEQPPEPFPFVIDGILPQAPGLINGTGGIGKTRLLLWMCICIALGRPFVGRTVREGRVLILSAEDERRVFEDRLYWMADALHLTANQQRVLLDRILIPDATGRDARLVHTDMAHNLVQTGVVPAIVRRYRDRNVRLVILDPVSNLGPGEIHGNDGGSALMSACWALSKDLGCAVQGVHHVAKAVVRDAIVDQHAGRGGSSYADNARHVWQITDAASIAKDRPAEVDELIYSGSRIIRLDVHKVSYGRKPDRPFYLADDGVGFDLIDIPEAIGSPLDRDVRMLCDILRADRSEGRKHTRNTLEGLPAERRRGLCRGRIRECLAEGMARGLIEERELPEAERHGGRKSYLVAAALGEVAGEVAGKEAAK